MRAQLRVVTVTQDLHPLEEDCLSGLDGSSPGQ
jgi:hypothetical protein